MTMIGSLFFLHKSFCALLQHLVLVIGFFRVDFDIFLHLFDAAGQTATGF